LELHNQILEDFSLINSRGVRQRQRVNGKGYSVSLDTTLILVTRWCLFCYAIVQAKIQSHPDRRKNDSFGRKVYRGDKKGCANVGLSPRLVACSEIHGNRVMWPPPFPIRITICCRREIARPLNFLLFVAMAASRRMNKDTTIDDFLSPIVNRRGATEQVILIPGSCATCAFRSRKT